MSQQTDVYEPIEPEHWPAESSELPPRPRRRLLTPLPLTLAGVLLIACGFIAGVLVEKGQSASSGAEATAGLSSRLAGLRSALGGAGGSRSGAGSGAGNGAGSGSGGGFGGGARSGAGGAGGLAARFGAGGAATIGEVAYIHGGTLYVTDAEGDTVKVKTSEASTVRKTVNASVKQIHPGETVTVIGQSTSGGTVLAQSISVGSGTGLGALLGAAAGGISRAGGAGASSGAGQSLFGK